MLSTAIKPVLDLYLQPHMLKDVQWDSRPVSGKSALINLNYKPKYCLLLSVHSVYGLYILEISIFSNTFKSV